LSLVGGVEVVQVFEGDEGNGLMTVQPQAHRRPEARTQTSATRTAGR
jgi:hypothetical protein